MGAEFFGEGYEEPSATPVATPASTGEYFGEDAGPEPVAPYTRPITPEERAQAEADANGPGMLDMGLTFLKETGKGIPANLGGAGAAGLTALGLAALPFEVPAVVGLGLGAAAYGIGNYAVRRWTNAAIGDDESRVATAFSSALDTAFAGLPVSKGIKTAMTARNAAKSAAKIETGELLQISKAGLRSEVNEAVSRMRGLYDSAAGSWPSKLRAKFWNGEEFKASGDALEVVKGAKPANIKELADATERNISELTSFRNNIAVRLDQKARDLADNAGNTGAVFAGSDDFAQAISDIKNLKTSLAKEAEAGIPEAIVASSHLDDLLQAVNHSGTFSFQQSLERIKSVNNVLDKLRSPVTGEAKAGAAIDWKAYDSLRKSFYRGMDNSLQKLNAAATNGEIELPKIAKGWNSLFADTNNQISVNIGIGKGIDDYLSRSIAATQSARSAETAASAGAASAPAKFSKARSITQDLRGDAERARLAQAGELADRNRVFQSLMGAFETGGAPEMAPPSLVSVAQPAVKQLAPGRAITAPMGGAAVNALSSPLEASAEEGSLGLPQGLKDEIAQAPIDAAVPSILSSAGAGEGLPGALPPEMQPPPPDMMPPMAPTPFDTAGGEGMDVPQGPTEPLPRTTDAFFKMSAADYPIEFLKDPELQKGIIDAQRGTREQRRATLFNLVQKYPDYFEPVPSGPLAGYKSLVDDKLMDPQEKERYQADMLEAFEGLQDPNKRILDKAEYLNALRTDGTVLEVRRPIERRAVEPLPRFSENNSPPEPKRKIHSEPVLSTMAKNSKASKVDYAY